MSSWGFVPDYFLGSLSLSLSFSSPSLSLCIRLDLRAHPSPTSEVHPFLHPADFPSPWGSTHLRPGHRQAERLLKALLDLHLGEDPKRVGEAKRLRSDRLFLCLSLVWEEGEHGEEKA